MQNRVLHGYYKHRISRGMQNRVLHGIIINIKIGKTMYLKSRISRGIQKTRWNTYSTRSSNFSELPKNITVSILKMALSRMRTAIIFGSSEKFKNFVEYVFHRVFCIPGCILKKKIRGIHRIFRGMHLLFLFFLIEIHAFSRGIHNFFRGIHTCFRGIHGN